MASNIVYLTEAGLQKLKDELDHLRSVERPAISAAIAEARDKGDLSENAEYDAAKEAQGMLEMRIAKLEDTVANARVIDESRIDTNTVQILNRVKMKNMTTGKIVEYTLVSENEANLKEGKLAIGTPIAQALLGKPRLLLCDEPTSALDPSGRREVLEILKSISKNTTVLFSTHILSDVERICDQIGILDGGRLVLEGALEEVRGSYRADRLLVVPQETASLAALAQGLGGLPEVQKAEVADGGVILTVGNPETAGREILRYLSACDIPIAKYELLEPNLEQVFLEAIHP